MRDAVVLCLDVDDNVIASPHYEHHLCKTPNSPYLDVNGVHEPINMEEDVKPNFWYQLLGEIKAHCDSKHAELLVYIITAKASGEADPTVDAVVKMLHEFLVVLGFDRSIDSQISAIQMPGKYLYALHTLGKMEFFSIENSFCPPFPNEPPAPCFYNIDQVLPSIHVVTGNVIEYDMLRSSKVLVMEKIYRALMQYGIIPIGMLLVDDDLDSYQPDLLNADCSIPNKSNLVKFIDAKDLCTTSFADDRITRITNANKIREEIIKEVRQFSSIHSLSGATLDTLQTKPSTVSTPLLQISVEGPGRYRSRGCCNCRSRQCHCCNIL